MTLTYAPLEPWLRPDHTWTKADLRTHARARRSGIITYDAADRLMLRYARIQLELVHPDLP